MTTPVLFGENRWDAQEKDLTYSISMVAVPFGGVSKEVKYLIMFGAILLGGLRVGY